MIKLTLPLLLSTSNRTNQAATLPVSVLCPDFIAVASGDNGELGERGHGASRPVLEERTVAIGVAGYDPGGRVTHFVNHRVSEPVRRV